MTSPRLVRVTVLRSSAPDQVCSNWSATWTSTLAPARGRAQADLRCVASTCTVHPP